MLNALGLVPALPFAGFVILAFAGKRMPTRVAAAIGAGSIGLSALAAMAVAWSFLSALPEGNHFRMVLWTWLDTGGFKPEIALYLDSLSLVMMLVVTFVGFLIHVYSIEYMRGDDAYSRFFAYMNLFVGSMLVLLLADNLLLLYLGWEGVGLCSYLLIGFWYKSPANARAAIKAFLVTRVGDTAMALGLFLLFFQLGSLNIQDLMQRAREQWTPGATVAIVAAALLLGGALGKSGQLPLQVWLPDAMAGPTPVSALIHAATMVTAGVYLIARTHVLFELAPPVQYAVAVIGAVTLVLAGFSALTQSDIKRVLAYSTISQIGYMFLGLGVGAWSAAIFHFMTHAFFKSLLFMAAGAIIMSLHHEQDMFKMGGLRKKLPIAFWTFLVGACSLAALPLITSGFYSKDLILWNVWASGFHGLWMLGFAGAFLTAIYTFRMVFLTFFGESKTHVSNIPGYFVWTPLIILAFLSTVGGFLDIPRTLYHFPLFTEFVEEALPKFAGEHAPANTEALFQLLTAATVLAGIAIAYYFYIRKPQAAEALAKNPVGALLHRFWFSGWGFDWVYARVFVRPFVWLADVNRDDFIDWIYKGIARVSREVHADLSDTQSGQMRWYAAGIALGAIIILGLVIFL